MIIERSDEGTISKSGAVCLPGKGKYSVSFVISTPLREQTLDVPMSGTLTIAPGAWRANLDVAGPVDIDFKTDGKPIRITGSMGIKSALSK